MATAQTKPRFAYFEGQIVPFENATVSIMTHALNYGTAVFGGLRGYWNSDEEQLYLFRPMDHFERFLQSAGLLRMELPHTPESLTEILRQLIQAEGYQTNCYVRPLAYKSSEMIGVKLHGVDDEISMFAIPFGSYVDDKEEGMHVGFSAWRRVDDNAIPARGKIAGSYANSALIKSDALLAGYDEALVLTQDGHLSESSAANLFIVRRGQLITPAVNGDVLEGITRRTVIELAREELGLTVVERAIDRTEVYVADEMFMCGTGVQIAAVTQVEHRNIGTGKMGEVTRGLSNVFYDVVTGRNAKYRHFLSPVYDKETARS
jgi:branched-chain amino acid aminotransferase